jgi:hypothetical protein
MPSRQSVLIGNDLIETTFKGNNIYFKVFNVRMIDGAETLLEHVEKEVDVKHRGSVVSVQSIIKKKIQNFLEKFADRPSEELPLNSYYGSFGFVPSACVGNTNTIVYKQGYIDKPFMCSEQLGTDRHIYVDKMSIIAVKKGNEVLYKIVESVSEKNKVAILKDIYEDEMPDPVVHQIRVALGRQSELFNIKKAS